MTYLYQWIKSSLSNDQCQMNHHYSDVIMGTTAFQITRLMIVCSTVYLGRDQSSASLAFVRGIHRWPVNSLHKGPVTWKMFPFDDAIMLEPMLTYCGNWNWNWNLHSVIYTWKCRLCFVPWYVYASADLDYNLSVKFHFCCCDLEDFLFLSSWKTILLLQSIQQILTVADW